MTGTQKSFMRPRSEQPLTLFPDRELLRSARAADRLMPNYRQAKVCGRGRTGLDDLLNDSVHGGPALSPDVQSLGGQFGGQMGRGHTALVFQGSSTAASD